MLCLLSVRSHFCFFFFFFFFQAEDGIRAKLVTGVQTCALPISAGFARVARPDPAVSARIIRTYYAITALFNLAMSLIWGIDTLFKLGAGLDIFHVMLTNAAFTLGSMVFEIPTGVVADTVGRRISLLLCLATL